MRCDAPSPRSESIIVDRLARAPAPRLAVSDRNAGTTCW
jgi:hypothetical protein